MAKKKMLSSEEAFSFFDSKMDKIFDNLEKAGYSGLSKPEKMIYLINGFEAGVRNGGLGSYLGNPQGPYVEDLIIFLREIKAGAIAKDVETLVRNIQEFFPAFPKDTFFGETLKKLPKERAEAYNQLEKECTKRLWEYESVLPLLHDYLSSLA